MFRVSGGWCLLFIGGGLLHTVGTKDGDSDGYKRRRARCYPLEKDGGAWIVRQRGWRESSGSCTV